MKRCGSYADEEFLFHSRRTGVLSQNLKPDVLMMEPAEDRYRRDTADILRPAKIWSIFVQRGIRTPSAARAYTGEIRPELGALFGPNTSIGAGENLFAWDSALFRLSPVPFVH